MNGTILNSDGSVDVGAFEVNGDWRSPSGYESVTQARGTALADGRFATVFENTSSRDDDGSRSILLRLFEADGTPVGEEFRPHTTTEGDDTQPEIATLDDGGFVVVWRGWDDGSETCIRAQVFEADGTRRGTEIQVNTETYRTQDSPDVIGLDDGGFMVTWSSNNAADGHGLMGQIFEADGTPRGVELVLSDWYDPTLGTYDSALTRLDDGRIVIVSSGYHASDPDVTMGIFDPDRLIMGTEEDDRLASTDLGDTVYGFQGDDVLLGRSGGDLMLGGAGADELFGGRGKDALDGGAGRDMLDGGSGRDKLLGRAGNDRLYGGEGNDKLTGGTGNDVLRGEAGDDALLGGAGEDSLNGGTERDVLYGGDDNDRLVGGGGNDWLWGEAGADELYGGRGKDTLDGGAKQDMLDGGDGRDKLLGRAGHDQLHGGNGNDRLIGGNGNDRLWGEAGADTFVYGSGTDRVMDFDVSEDRLKLDTALWGDETLTAEEIVDLAVVKNGNTIFDFDHGDVLVLKDFTDTAALVDALLF